MEKIIKMKLSKTQQRVLEKLTNEWQSSYTLGEGLNTLESLVNKGLIEVKRELGSSFMPRIQIKFRKKDLKDA